MICGRKHGDSSVWMKTVKLIEKERLVVTIDHRVEIFENDDAGTVHTSPPEHCRHVFLFCAAFRFEAANVETGLFKLVYQRLERMCFPVPRWTNEERAAFPRYTVALIELA